MDRETGEWIVAVASDVVTKAKPGSTAHNVVSVAGQPAALAVDVVPLCEDGTADWLVSMSFWDHLYELSWKVGLDPLGDVTGDFLAGDLGHFQEPGWKLKLDGLGLYLPTVQEQRV